MNDLIQDGINGNAGHFLLLDDVMKFAAADLLYLIVPLIVLVWFWPGGAQALRQRVAFAAVAAVVLALGAGMAVAHVHYAARPFVSDAGTRLLISHAPDNGFPSDHALVAFAVAGALTAWRTVAAVAAVIVAALIGVARVFVGVHWPFDVAVGAAVGFGAGLLVAQAVPFLVVVQKRAASVFPRWLVAQP